ncbi:MAG: hypothetical protein JWR74_668 [Polaromonas sp.]|nr:hypothetical protein [Polaromonas sp.]
MAKDETASGLLSKLVKFVRNPATNWTELDSINGSKDDAVTKQALNEMIERKRRNDFVRKREFDMLRKLQKLGARVGTASEIGSRPSFFQSSITSNVEDRAVTLKKIDDIEAQMSMQWWKTKNYVPSSAQNDLVPLPFPPAQQPVASPLVAAAGPAPRADAAAPKFLQGALVQAPPLGLEQSGFPKIDNFSDSSNMGILLPISGSAMPERKRDPIVHDADLEEAAILFANGDDAGAEFGLLEILALGASHADDKHAWLTVFDLYRATGEHAKFETAALEFALRFSRSAPQWYSLPDQVKALVQPSEKPIQQSMDVDWVCASVLGTQSLGVLHLALARVPMPWRLDWSHLKSIDAAALEPLLKLFSHLASHAVKLRFMGELQLQAALAAATPSSERATDAKWWLLRLEMLRVIHRPDDFELAALDFCVTYEVSPPAWEVAGCEYRSLDEDGDGMGSATIIGEPITEYIQSTLMGLEDEAEINFADSTSIRSLTVDLSGHIQGDAVGVMERLEASLMGAEKMQISCAKLIRVDFSAAGMLLNWVAARHAENRYIEFYEVNRLVAAFFNVIGIVEYARVTARSD